MEESQLWDLSPEQAVEEQLRIRKLLRHEPVKEVNLVAGVDLSFSTPKSGNAVVVVMDLKTLQMVEYVKESCPIAFPYIPGLLAFREGPVFLKAWEKLRSKPDVVMFDGQGIAHPRRMGIAAHMGVILQIPTIGVAKSHLYGKYKEPSNEKGSYEYLYADDGEIVGAVVRTKSNTKPLFISPGHMCDLQSSIDLVLRCCTSYRLPEPTRMAHLLCEKLKDKGDKLFS